MRTRDIERNAREEVRFAREALKKNGETVDIDGETFLSVYMGSVMALTPSGKYYMPFACSNVTEKEALQDEAWWAAAEKEAAQHGGWLECGEGDPTDVFYYERCAVDEKGFDERTHYMTEVQS